MNILEIIAEKKEEFNIWEYGLTTTDQLSIKQTVREQCECNYCGHFGKSWACPPAVGTLDECTAKVLSYKNIFVFTTKHDIEDPFDWEGMEDGQAIHCDVSDKVTVLAKEVLGDDIFCLAKGVCQICDKCTYPDAPCRFPEQLSPGVEAYGIEVNRLAATLGINYINGENTVTYFGCILYND